MCRTGTPSCEHRRNGRVRADRRTRLLQPSLSGDALISVICTVSPSALNLAESLSTLSFAQGLKRVTLKAQKKEMVDPQALIQQYQNEIAELKALLREKEVSEFQDAGKVVGHSEVRSQMVFEVELNASGRRMKLWRNG